MSVLSESGDAETSPLAHSMDDIEIQLSGEDPFADSPFKPLTWDEAYDRQKQFGKNIISSQKPPRWYKILLNAIIHPFNGILAVLSIVAGATKDFHTMAVMLIMVTISVVIRFIQDMKSSVAAEALKTLVSNEVTVIRYYTPPFDRDPTFDDLALLDTVQEYDILLQDVVPGDIIKLSAGDMIPGDVLLLSSKDLFISQASFTGESIPVEKIVDLTNMDTEIDKNDLDRKNICFMGTSVVSGKATAVVVNTGERTSLGSLSKKLSSSQPTNTFQKGIRRVSFLFVGIMAVMVPIVFVISGLVQKDWLQAFLFSISVAVGMTPEMLPMIVNANLARGAIVMAKKRTIVKRMDAIVNFGAIDILCTDKTGTLTQNKVVLLNHYNLDGDICYTPLQYAYLNSYFQTGLKNLLDAAVIEFYEEKMSNKDIVENYSKVDEIPFDFFRRRMSVILEEKVSKNRKLVTKGAVEELLSICSSVVWKDDSIEHLRVRKKKRTKKKKVTDQVSMVVDKVPLDDEIFSKAVELGEKLNEEGLRVIAVAYKDIEDTDKEFDVSDEVDLTLVGFIAFLDPPKETTEQSIRELREHGIEVKILTGDSHLVCNKVCRQVGLPVLGTILASDLEGKSVEEIAEIAENTTIFAKLSPIQKADVIKALRLKGHSIGFLGDGINDAVALREADVGISVDEGTDVAKESADIILLEKSLLVLSKGVTLGRITFMNTIKYIKMAISSNFGNVISMIVASAWLPFLPMLPIHIVVQNLLYDVSQIAIPWDNVDEDFIEKPKTWNARGILKFLLIGPVSSIFDILTFIYMYYYFGIQKKDDNTKLFQTGWFVMGLLTQTLIIHMIRTDKWPIFQSRAAWQLTFATVTIMSLGVAIIYIPTVNTYLNMVPLPGMYYPFLFGSLLGYCILSQIAKLIYIRVFNEWL